MITLRAMPNSPHLEWHWAGYTLLNLAGLSMDITAADVVRIDVDGVEQTFRPHRHRMVMITPAFRQEAQTIKVHCRELTPKPAVRVQARVVPPAPTYGFTAPESRYERGL